MRDDCNTHPIEDLRYHLEERGGVLYWKVPTAGQFRVGSRAGGKKPNPDGYFYIKFKGQNFLVHRIVMALRLGRWPGYVDHRNGIRTDNSEGNLRETTFRGNMSNRVLPDRDLPRGVYRRHDGKKYIAKIKKMEEQIHLGSFDTIEEAEAAYKTAALQVHGEFAFHESRA